MRQTMIPTTSDSIAGAASARPRYLGMALALALALAGCLLLLCASVASAQGEGFGIKPASFVAKTHEPLTMSPSALHNAPEAEADAWLDAIDDAPPLTQAGAHPDASAVFDLNTRIDAMGQEVTHGNPRDIEVDLPAGFAGNPQAMATCTLSELLDEEAGVQGSGRCGPDSQVGIAVVKVQADTDSSPVWWVAPVHSIDPPSGAPAAFAFVTALPTVMVAEVRSDGDYGLTVRVPDLPTPASIYTSAVTFWGVPADPVHDPDRWDAPADTYGRSLSVGQPRPFLNNPSHCDSGPLTTTIRARPWQDPATWVSDSDVAPEPTGCDLLQFGTPVAPVSFSAQPNARTADTPTGLEVNLALPYNDDPDGLARPTLRDAVVELPEGMAVSPSAANGLAACTPGQIGLDSRQPPSCPDASKLGTVEVETPLLADPLRGHVYQATQDDNPFGSTLAIYLHVQGSGVQVKLPGHVEPDPQTGRLKTTFSDNPQLPFTEMTLRFKGGPRAPLVTPPTCGVKTTSASFIPWSAPHSGPPATLTDSFAIAEGPNGMPCASSLGSRPFDLDLSAGLVNPVAGSTSPFVLRLTRPDGRQEIDSIQVMPPEGLAAYLRGIPLCSNAQANVGNCPAASRVGSAVTGAGPGPQPFFVRDGEVFLTGPYKGGPLGLLIQVPAVAGPFDLGVVDVRAAVHVDPRTAQLRVVSDPIPRILEGIPLRVRDIRVAMDRPNFTIAPTSGDPTEVRARVRGSHGATVDLSDRFQVIGAQSLDFDPSFGFRVRGRNSDRPNRRPRIVATVDFADDETSEANIKRASVVLPRRMIVDQDNIATTCTRAQFAARDCPDETRVGWSLAHSPLLDEPLRGPVHLIASENPLPDMVADLRGIVNVELHGRIHSQGIRVRNTFDIVPDVPVSRFRLNLRGGRDGILVNGANLCRRAKFRRVDVRVHAHNNDNAHQRTFIRVNRCLRMRANRLERRAQRLKRRARQARSLGNGRRAQRMGQRANRLERRAERVRSRLD